MSDADGKNPPQFAAPASITLPRSREDITVGHLVLGQADSAEDGWWEVIVIKVEGDMLTVRLRDYPKEPTYRRHRNAVALLHPAVQ